MKHYISCSLLMDRLIVLYILFVVRGSLGNDAQLAAFPQLPTTSSSAEHPQTDTGSEAAMHNPNSTCSLIGTQPTLFPAGKCS